MYNKQFKEKFLGDVESSHMERLFVLLFSKSQEFEEEYKVDLYDFQTRELEEFYYGLETPSQHTLQVYHSLIISYVDYAIEKGERASNINIFRNIRGVQLQKYVASYKEQYLTLEEFNKFMDYVVNDSDVAIYRSLFEGIGGTRYSEFRNMKMSDIKKKNDQYYINLIGEDLKGNKTERTIPITDALKNDLERANKQYIYTPDNGTSDANRLVEVMDSPYIFRPLKRGAYRKSGGQVNMQTIYRKMKLLQDLTDGQIKNMNTLVSSGMAHEANQIYQDKGELTVNDYLKIGEKFDKNIKSEYNSVRANHIKNLITNGLRDRYNIEI